MRRALVAWVVVVACGDNQQPIEVAVPGATAAFAAYKADGVWHPAVATARGFRVDAAGPYQFVFVCADDQDFDVEELFADTSDGDQFIDLYAGIDPCVAPSVAALGTVAGQVLQPGSVAIGSLGAEGLSPSWSYAIDVTLGRHDLVFRPSSALTPVLRRDLVVASGTNAQATIDATSEGIALERVPIELEALPDGAIVDSTTTLVTSNGELLAIATGDAVSALLPATALRAGERQLLDVKVLEDAFTFHDVTLDTAGGLGVVIHPLPEVTYTTSDTATAVAWRNVPLSPSSYDLLVTNPGTASIIHGVATASVVHGTLDLSVDRDAAGFLDAWRPTWSHDLDSSSRTFHVTASGDSSCYESTMIDLGRATTGREVASRCGLLRH